MLASKPELSFMLTHASQLFEIDIEKAEAGSQILKVGSS